MCGIAGVIAWDDRYRVNRETLASISARIAHRGPDGQGLYLNHEQEISPNRPQVGLVHRRLAVIDLDPRANQPFADLQRRHIVFNGEIYNYRQLRAELTTLNPHYPWRTTSDTEVLLAAYAAWGEQCVDHLNGMFAFAIWDDTAQSLFLARDRMGQKPLYFTRADGVFAFASELHAFHQLPWFQTEIDGWGFDHYLELGYAPGSLTIYESASKLEPGHWMRPSARQAKSVPYFNPNAINAADGPALSDRAAVAQTRRLLTQAVQRQLVADVPIGCFLSGGIDSSITACLMRQLASPGQAVHTFSIGFDDPRYDETPYAAAVAKHLGTHHQQFTVRPNAAEDLPKLAAVHGEPFADSSSLPTHYLSRETRRHVKVALSGDGGDELFGGYDRYRAMQLGEKIRSLPEPLRRLFINPLWQRLRPAHPKSRWTHLVRFLATLHFPPRQRYESYLHIFNQELAEKLQNAEFISATGSTPHSPTLTPNAVRGALALDRAGYLPDDLLAKVDRASMLHALEVRSPFMDHDLVHFAAGLSTDQLLRGGPKRMLREAFAPDLPSFVFKRRKMGFAVPIGDWFRNTLRPMLHDLLFASDSFASQYFYRPFIQQLIDEHQQSRADHSQRLYALLMLELWQSSTRP